MAGSPSNYRMLSIYQSVSDRIKATQILRVATSPTLTGIFNSPGENGLAEGFDVDLATLIAKNLADPLQMPKAPQVKFIELPWDDLLNKLISNDVDIVISGMTATKQREVDYKGIKFSSGYADSQEILISVNSIPNCTLENVAGKVVGVIPKMTNELAAMRLLARNENFKVDNSYESYDGIYQALEERKIDFGLVDDAYGMQKIKPEFYQCGPPLGNILSKTSFYRDDIGYESEHYSVAVKEDFSANNNMLGIINDILSKKSDAIQCLRKKWMTSHESNGAVVCGD